MKQRHGFIFLLGTRTLFANEGSPLQAACPKCGQEANFQNKSARNWFTLFLLPVFPIESKRTICQCSNCQARFAVSAEQLSRRAVASQAHQTQQAIQMYNSLRASPANSITLNNLMLLYLELKEYDQAVSAANEFQQALNASEQCMTTLGRVLAAQGRYADAIKWFDATIARNSMAGEAAYFKALALMNLTPPDLTAAATVARAARTAGFNGAEALLRQIEERSRTAVS